MSTPIANARMYSATPSVRQDWRELLQWTLARAGLDWPVIDHDPPAPLAALWARDDLGLAMMCGLPFSQRGVRPTIVAAPVPSPARYAHRPTYFTDIVVAAESRHQRLEDTFGGTVGYTLADSMSGGVAFRNQLAPYRARRGARLYARAVDNLINARGVIEALAAGTIDVGPLDSYYHDLLRANEPALAGKVRVIASSEAMPIPPLVATAPLAAPQLQALRDALRQAGVADELGPLRARLLLSGFAVPEASDYDVLDVIARRPVPSFEDL
jgi:ABC-type phosphate/phosphonate transport system substrate-binding protein